MTTTQTTIADKVAQVNALLQQDETVTPITLSSISKDTHTGYYGYKPQHIVDAMNSIFGYDGWGFREVKSELKETLAIAQVEVWLKGVEFKPIAWGQSKITRGDVGDALKGADTDGLKKALSYFSIGNRAYRGLLEEVYKQAEAAAAREAAAKDAAARKAAAAARNQNRPTQPQANSAAPAVTSAPAKVATPAAAAPASTTPDADTIERAIKDGAGLQMAKDLFKSMAPVKVKGQVQPLNWVGFVLWTHAAEINDNVKNRQDLAKRAGADKLDAGEVWAVWSKLLEIKERRESKQAQPAEAVASAA